ncbi:rhomboid family intramembrane serine protease, partial [Staphylococcus aureus]
TSIALNHSEINSGDTPVTYILIAANCLFYLVAAHFQPSELLKVDSRTLINAGASFAAVDEPWRLITACFLHTAWWHLLLNMLALHWLGRV